MWLEQRGKRMARDKFGQITEFWGSWRDFYFYSKTIGKLLRVWAESGMVRFTFKMTESLPSAWKMDLRDVRVEKGRWIKRLLQ